MGVAKNDYRDVLAPTECPSHSKIGWTRVVGLAPEEKRLMVEKDWQQYDEWLNKPDS